MTILALGIGDLLFLHWRWHHASGFASVTYVGLDSLIVLVPTSQPAAAWRGGQWTPDLAHAVIASEDGALHKRTLTLITLAPDPTYGNFLHAIRHLRAKEKCNVLIREGNQTGDERQTQFAIPAFVLCGSSIGDAGFSGTLPPDRAVRL